MRTCDAFGIHTLHVITERNRFRINRRISQGSHLYVELKVHRSTDEAIRYLHDQGFMVLVTDPGGDGVVDPHDLRQELENRPLALMFGSEEVGVSQRAKEASDGRFAVPMAGFTQSLNLSVTVAVTLFSIRHVELAEEDEGDMSAGEQRRWYDCWIRRQAARGRSENGQS
jgi:tRNA (guanosine-2'-O-)-methyltransferase